MLQVGITSKQKVKLNANPDGTLATNPDGSQRKLTWVPDIGGATVVVADDGLSAIATSTDIESITLITVTDGVITDQVELKVTPDTTTPIPGTATTLGLTAEAPTDK